MIQQKYLMNACIPLHIVKATTLPPMSIFRPVRQMYGNRLSIEMMYAALTCRSWGGELTDAGGKRMQFDSPVFDDPIDLECNACESIWRCERESASRQKSCPVCVAEFYYNPARPLTDNDSYVTAREAALILCNQALEESK